MKIALSGSQSVGKTTLANKLNKHLKLPYIHEVARSMINLTKEYNVDYRELKGTDHFYFQEAILNIQYMLESLYQFTGFISDRSLIDIQAYSKHYMRASYNVYDYIIYVPIEFALEQDGIRHKGQDFQKEIDQKIQKLLKQYIPEHKIITVTGSVEERVEQVLKAIKK